MLLSLVLIIIAHSTDFVICQHMTYEFLFLFAFVRTISYQNWFVNVVLYYLQLFTIIAYHLNAHIMCIPYVICHYISHMWKSESWAIISEQSKYLITKKKVQEETIHFLFVFSTLLFEILLFLVPSRLSFFLEQSDLLALFWSTSPTDSHGW